MVFIEYVYLLYPMQYLLVYVWPRRSFFTLYASSEIIVSDFFVTIKKIFLKIESHICATNAQVYLF